MTYRCSILFALFLLVLTAPDVALAGPNLDYDLWANTPLAHVQLGGPVADGGAAGFAKYTRDNRGRWKLGAREGGRPVALPPGRRVRLWLPIGPEQGGKAHVLDFLLKPVGAQRVQINVGGKSVGSEKLAGTWQHKRYAVPAATVKAGFVEVRMLFERTRYLGKVRTPAAVRYVRLAVAGTARLPQAEAALSGALASRSGNAVRVPKGGGLDFYITPVAGLRLTGAASGGKLEVLTQLDGQQPRRLGGGATLGLSLDGLAGKAVRLMLRASGGDVKLRGGRITGSKGTGLNIKAAPRRVVFWMIDTLRADKLKFYSRRGKRRPQVKTPHLSALAGAGAVFDPFWVNSNESKTGHASFWTGTYPQVHKVVSHKAKLRSRYHTLSKAFKQAGYRTAAFVGNGYISKRWNYMQGFDKAVNFIREEKPSHAKQIVNSALKWLKRNKDQRFYLYLGTNDPHVTYRAHKGFIKQYDPRPYNGPYRRYLAGKSMEKIKVERRNVSRRNKQRIEALYENEIAYNDHHLGRLLAGMKELGLDKDTLVIVTSDHGEEFWEHGSCGHGHSLYQELISVPLILHWPGVIPRTRVLSGHDGTDLLATVLDLLRKPAHPQIQGESLLPFVNARATYPRGMMATKELTMHALRAGLAKVILRGTDSLRVYDMSRDPAEKRNLFGERMVLTLCALDPLSLFVPRAKKWKKATWGVPNNLLPGFLKDN